MAHIIYLYPELIGAFTGITVRIFITPIDGLPVDIDKDLHDAHLLVFRTDEGEYNMFLNSGDADGIIESMSSGIVGTHCKIRRSQQDALTWTMSFPDMIQYRVTLRNARASDRFAILANFWMHSMGARGGGIHHGLREQVVSGLAGQQWEDDEAAFGEIDMITSTFALSLTP